MGPNQNHMYSFPTMLCPTKWQKEEKTPKGQKQVEQNPIFFIEILIINDKKKLKTPIQKGKEWNTKVKTNVQSQDNTQKQMGGKNICPNTWQAIQEKIAP